MFEMSNKTFRLNLNILNSLFALLLFNAFVTLIILFILAIYLI